MAFSLLELRQLRLQLLFCVYCILGTPDHSKNVAHFLQVLETMGPKSCRFLMIFGPAQCQSLYNLSARASGESGYRTCRESGVRKTSLLIFAATPTFAQSLNKYGTPT